jgi:hypothetical protein
MKRWGISLTLVVSGILLGGCDFPGFARCGDGYCRSPEDVETCPQDCLTLIIDVAEDDIVVLGTCGDGTCGEGEYPWNCPDDCFCGDGVCRGEICCTCPEDCGFGDPDVPCGGNRICDWYCGENYDTAPEDCTLATLEEFCGNGTCDTYWYGETCNACPEDCAPCPVCGDGVCESDEHELNCPEDCGEGCGDGCCIPWWGEYCATCPEDCGSCEACGDGICDSEPGNGSGENCTTCPDDCDYGNSALPCCGNGYCEGSNYGESQDTCMVDCGMPLQVDIESGPELPGVVSVGCGNGVCQPGFGETPETCPRDCEAEDEAGGCPPNTDGCTVDADCWDISVGRDVDWHCIDCMCHPPCNFNDVCEPGLGEHVGNCSEDCSACGDGFFSPAAGEACDVSAGILCGTGELCDEHCQCIPDPDYVPPSGCSTPCTSPSDCTGEGPTCMCSSGCCVCP